MSDPVKVWFEIAQYNYKGALSISNLVETMWISIYRRPIEIMYYQGSASIGHEFRKSLIETEYGKTSKTRTSVNPIFNAVLERIHQVLGNLLRTCNINQTYVD